MAATQRVVSWTFLLFSTLLLLLLSSSSTADQLLKQCKLDQIYQVGDSFSDTGNLIIENPNTPYSKLPYGQTYFKKPTGRCSDGLLMIDYFALSAGLPFLNPYLNIDGLTRNGDNFAVAGATALPQEFYSQIHISTSSDKGSLSNQLDWMFTHFNSICYDYDDCQEKLKPALFVVGEIGGNDYNIALIRGKFTIEKVKETIVPRVIEAIKAAVQRVIQYGGVRVVVPGNFPVGCFPIYLTYFQTNDAAAYDELHCLKDFNALATYHNEQLQIAIEELKKENPKIIIVYADYYKYFLWLLRGASNLGLDAKSVQKSCCGVGGDYNFSFQKMCGEGVPVCPNPEKYISWDGVHLTQKANGLLSFWTLRDILPHLHCN